MRGSRHLECLFRRATTDGLMSIVYCIQHDIAWEDRQTNHSRVESLMEEVSPSAGSLVLLPEMFDAGFSFNLPVVAETEARETSTFLARLAVKHRIWLMGGVVQQSVDGKGLNQAAVFNPCGADVVRYTKQRPFAPGGEAACMQRGGASVVFDWEGCSVSPFICYDLRFPELQRDAARMRPHLMTFIASWPEARIAHWVALLRARAIENQCYVAGVNRVGRDPKFQHVGRSMIISPMGEVLADAGSTEGGVSARLDISTLEEYRRTLPFLEDMTVGASRG